MLGERESKLAEAKWKLVNNVPLDNRRGGRTTEVTVVVILRSN